MCRRVPTGRAKLGKSDLERLWWLGDAIGRPRSEFKVRLKEKNERKSRSNVADEENRERRLSFFNSPNCSLFLFSSEIFERWTAVSELFALATV